MKNKGVYNVSLLSRTIFIKSYFECWNNSIIWMSNMHTLSVILKQIIFICSLRILISTLHFVCIRFTYFIFSAYLKMWMFKYLFDLFTYC